MRVGIITSGLYYNYRNQLLTSNIHINGRNCLREDIVFLPIKYFDTLVRESVAVELERVKI